MDYLVILTDMNRYHDFVKQILFNHQGWRFPSIFEHVIHVCFLTAEALTRHHLHRQRQSLPRCLRMTAPNRGGLDARPCLLAHNKAPSHKITL